MELTPQPERGSQYIDTNHLFMEGKEENQSSLNGNNLNGQGKRSV